MRQWIAANWDKLFLPVVGGIVGFYAATMTTRDKISVAQTDIALIKAAIEDTHDPAALEAKKLRLDMARVQRQILNLQDSEKRLEGRHQILSDRFDSRVQFVQEMSDLARERTVNELIRLVDLHMSSRSPGPGRAQIPGDRVGARGID